MLVLLCLSYSLFGDLDSPVHFGFESKEMPLPSASILSVSGPLFDFMLDSSFAFHNVPFSNYYTFSIFEKVNLLFSYNLKIEIILRENG